MNRLPKWTLTPLCVAAILWLTLAPHPLPDVDLPLFPGVDKVVHALMMAGLLWSWALDVMRSRRRWCRPAHILPAAVCVVAFGGAIELIQMEMHAGRGAEWLDFAADTAGAVIAALTLLLFKKYTRKSSDRDFIQLKLSAGRNY